MKTSKNETAGELVLLPLGGVGEIGMNLALYGLGPAANRKWLMVDCGVTFASEFDEPGVDLIYPDIRFAENERRNIVGIVITHAHEDHFGALLELWPKLKAPVHMTPFAAGLLCLTPIFFLVSLTAGLRHRGDVTALVLGLSLAPICERFIGGGFDLIVAGLIAGSIAFMIGRKRKAAA